MLKRTFAALTFAFALVALNTMSPAAVSAQEEIAIDEGGEFAGGDCLIWCVSHQTHHTIKC